MKNRENCRRWTEQRLAEARQLYMVEGKSATQVARIMGDGLTRNSIIGIAHRKGWLSAGRQAAAAPSASARPARTPKAPPVARAVRVGPTASQKATGKDHRTQVAVVFGGVKALVSGAQAQTVRDQSAEIGNMVMRSFAAPANDDAIPLLARRRFQCAWPVGIPARPAEQLCCGQPVAEGGTPSTESYCAHHRRIAVARVLAGGAPDAKKYERAMRRWMAA